MHRQTRRAPLAPRPLWSPLNFALASNGWLYLTLVSLGQLGGRRFTARRVELHFLPTGNDCRAILARYAFALKLRQRPLEARLAELKTEAAGILDEGERLRDEAARAAGWRPEGYATTRERNVELYRAARTSPAYVADREARLARLSAIGEAERELRESMRPGKAYGETEAERLALFAELLGARDLSHVTDGHAVSRDSYHVYRRDPRSPSGCYLAASFPKSPESAAVLARSRRSAELGGQRGEAATRRALYGR